MSDNAPPPGGGYGAPPPPAGGEYGAPPPPPPPGGGYGGPPPPPGGGYGGPPAPPGYGYGGAPKTNQKAIWSLVLGIIGLLCCGFLTGIPALILGKMAQNEIDVSGGTQTGRGMATAGFVLGIIAIVFGVLGVILFATGAFSSNA